MRNGSGDHFQQETKYYRGKLLGGGLDWRNKPSLYKEYPHSTKILLPPHQAGGKMTFDLVLRRRRSVRRFTSHALSREQLSYLLWASSGIQRQESGYQFRTVPSAGALYPIETYLVIHNVENTPKGVYHYSVKSHLLEELQLGDFRRDISHATLGQQMCMDTTVIFIWTAIFERSKWKYKQRAYRYIYLDAGHIAQNLALSATSLNLGSCQIGALYDDEVNQIINVDGTQESVIYMSIVGHPQ